MLQILVIDDDLVMRIVLKKTLQEQGYEAIVAKNGKEGIELAQKHHPALVNCTQSFFSDESARGTLFYDVAWSLSAIAT